MPGKPGRAMIEALIAGARDPTRLAGLALGVPGPAARQLLAGR
jgi:hypothetical protein